MTVERAGAFTGHAHDWKDTEGGGQECACGASRRPTEGGKSQEVARYAPNPAVTDDTRPIEIPWADHPAAMLLSAARENVMMHVHGDLETRARGFNEGYALALVHAMMPEVGPMEGSIDEALDDADALAQSWPDPTVYEDEEGNAQIIILRTPGVRIAGGTEPSHGGPHKILGVFIEGETRRTVPLTRRDDA